MKKLFCLFLCAVMLLSLCFCAQISAAPLKWSKETQNMIKRDYARLSNEDSVEKVSADDVIIEDYYGIYQDNAVALFITSANECYFFPIIEEDIANCHFTFGSTQPLYIYHKGQFTPIGEAYANGIISKEDVSEIHKMYSLGMDKELYDKIRQDYANANNEFTRSSVPKGYEFHEFLAEDIEIRYNFGTYHDDLTALLLYTPSMIVADGFASTLNIAGVTFKWIRAAEPPYIYSNGSFTPLDEAYEKGMVSKEDVEEIHRQYERNFEK